MHAKWHCTPSVNNGVMALCILNLFLCPPVYTGGHIVFALSVGRLFVCLFVCANFNIGHNFCNIEDSNLIFGMHVYLMELHILSGERSRSRSSFKVKGQIYGSKSLKSGHSVSQTHLVFTISLQLSGAISCKCFGGFH